MGQPGRRKAQASHGLLAWCLFGHSVPHSRTAKVKTGKVKSLPAPFEEKNRYNRQSRYSPAVCRQPPPVPFASNRSPLSLLPELNRELRERFDDLRRQRISALPEVALAASAGSFASSDWEADARLRSSPRSSPSASNSRQPKAPAPGAIGISYGDD